MRRMLPWGGLLCLVAWTLPANAAPLATLRIETGRGAEGFTLAGRDAAQQLVVSGEEAGGAVRDLTRAAKYSAAPAGVVEVSATGLVTPRGEGTATISVQAEDRTATVKVTVSHLVEDLPISFPNLVTPVFTKFGCNSGGCHGKADGQNHFKLSLLGFEPTEDYEYLVKEARGRRLFPAAPAESLLLRKAIGVSPHGGGKRLEPGSPHYRILLRWVAQGMPYGDPIASAVERIEVTPGARILPRQGTQQLLVVAHLHDGTTEDVTRLSQLEANVPEMAEISPTGLVTIHDTPGAVAVMARYQSHVAVFAATIPLGVQGAEYPQPANVVDERVFGRLRELGLPPSATCDDATFLRRATLDIAGRLPTLDEAAAYLADASPDKHEKLVDRLLASDDYADYFANKWSAILRNRRKSDKDDAEPTLAFHTWIRDQLKSNAPYDQMVRGVLTATGKAVENPPVIWFREVRDVPAQLEDTAQLFLGQRIACARCHHHPFEKWSQNDYYHLAAFFTQLDIKDAKPGKAAKKGEKPEPGTPFEVSFKPGKATATNPKTGQALAPAGLAAPPLEIDSKDDAREKLAAWMTAPENPFFAKSLVNRYWKHFFSRGLVEPEDDMRATNPPTNPALLEALAQEFTASKYDLKRLVRLICVSQAYRLSATPNEHNLDDKQNFSRFLPKRLNAEVLLDAIDAVTEVKTQFKGAKPETRAVQLPDNQFSSYFLSVFGRPDAASACECERSSAATLAQCVHMFNSKEILGKVSQGRAAKLAKDKRPHAERIRELYLAALGREPSPQEQEAVQAYIAKRENEPQAAYEDLVWALINSKEFLFNH